MKLAYLTRVHSLQVESKNEGKHHLKALHLIPLTNGIHYIRYVVQSLAVPHFGQSSTADSKQNPQLSLQNIAWKLYHGIGWFLKWHFCSLQVDKDLDKRRIVFFTQSWLLLWLTLFVQLQRLQLLNKLDVPFVL